MQEPIEVVTTMPHPAVGLCADVRETLESEGIPVEGKKVSASDSDAMQILSYESPVLPEILKSLLFRSDNMYAESVQRKLGESIYGDPQREYGEKAVTKIVEQWGINMDKVTLYDGSGLSRTNRMTPLFLASVLRSAALDWQTGDLFPTLLPRCGVDGTVRNLLKGTCLSGNIALKSGSMTGVRCYAGYYPAERPRYSVVLLTNNFHCTYEQLKSSIERLWWECLNRIRTLLTNDKILLNYENRHKKNDCRGLRTRGTSAPRRQSWRRHSGICVYGNRREARQVADAAWRERRR